MIRGITVVLYEKTAAGKDAFNREIFTEMPRAVDNVLVGQGNGTEVTDSVNLTGKKASWTLAIPKGDTHEWRDSDVVFWLGGIKHRVHTCGAYTEGIEELMPLCWHRQIGCEEYA